MTVNHGGNVWQGGAPADWLDFSANLNPDGPPGWAMDAIRASMDLVSYYPDPGMAGARRALAAHLCVPEENVLPCAGGSEAISLAGALEGPHVIAEPAFGEYSMAAPGARHVWRAAVSNVDMPRGANLWLCNPSNPTGEAMGPGEVMDLRLKCARQGGRLIVDEAFIDYCPEKSVRRAVIEHGALIVLGSMTKALCVPGVRLGYLLARSDVLGRIQARQRAWPLSAAADALARALPGHEDYFARLQRDNAARRAGLRAGLARLGAQVSPSQASFLLARFDRPVGGLVAALRDQGMLVRTCEDFQGLTDRHLRIAVKRDGENARLLAALEAAW